MACDMCMYGSLAVARPTTRSAQGATLASKTITYVHANSSFSTCLQELDRRDLLKYGVPSRG